MRLGFMGNFRNAWIARKVARRCSFKKKSGSISVVVNEIYLRDDIACGSPLCRSCSSSTAPHLPSDASHYLVPNADAILQFWEILELAQFSAVIFLSSVLKEVQRRSTQRGWRRLKSIFTDRRRCNILFDDVHCMYTSLSFNGEAPDYVQAITEWFSDHLDGRIPVILVTGIEAEPSCLSNYSRKIQVLTAETYFRTFWQHDPAVSELYSSLALAHTEARRNAEADLTSKGSKGLYKEHLSASSLEGGIANGSLRIGIFSVSKHATSEAYVRPSNKGEASRLEILVPGRAMQNRALHGDSVAVRVIHDVAEMQDSEGLDDSLDIGEENQKTETEALFTGEVVGILQRIQRDYVACLAEEDEATLASSLRQARLLCIPMDKRIPMVDLTTRQGLLLSKQRFIVRIDNWETDSRYPRGHLVRKLGPIGDLSAEMMAILVENGISAAPFSTLSLQELPEDAPEKPWTIPEDELRSRRDLRFSHRCCSIDPPGSKDVDDVLSVSYLDNGLVEVGVHIADVSYFVRQGSLLDLEARARGTTVYMVGKSWHMLPSVLSENLCSLVGGKDRLAVSVIWTLDIDRDYEITGIWFGRTIIRSQHQLFYAQAETILEGRRLKPGWEIKSDDSSELAKLRGDLEILAAFARNRRSLRKHNGALELASMELKFEVDGKEPVQVETKAELPMNWIVAEMMILANSCVAEKIYRTFHCSLLRKHVSPKYDNFTMLLQCCEARGYPLDVSSNKRLAASLDSIRGSGDPIVERAFRALVTRAMSEAEYFSTGDNHDPSHFYHYGLALEYYTHFTSPIRRYADVLVHRLLIAACQSSEVQSIMNPMELQEVAEHLNERHRASKRAQKECNELYLLTYLQKHTKAECGVVINVISKGLMVFVPKYDLRGPVYLEDKNGQAILPELDATNSQNCPEPGQKYGLVKESTFIKIVDLADGKDVVEYKLMDVVWVRLRADGTRAHGPMLKMDLLSNKHPSVLESQAEDISYSMTDLNFFRSAGSENSSKRSKAIEAMVELVAAQKASEGMAAQRKRSQISVPDVLENIKQAKTSSLYVDMENVDNATGFAEGLGFAHNMSSATSGHSKAAPPVIAGETPAETAARKKWQEKLAKAGTLRAKFTTSTSANESERQQSRARNELEVRQAAVTERTVMQNASGALR